MRLHRLMQYLLSRIILINILTHVALAGYLSTFVKMSWRSWFMSMSFIVISGNVVTVAIMYVFFRRWEKESNKNDSV